ncbi:MAG: MFS transporter [Candidatus Aramenus sp.]|nr:MFS transporter [Candidatus Aramenus sp.]
MRRPLLFALVLVLLTFSFRASDNMLTTTLPLIAKYYFHFSSLTIGLVSSLATVFAFLSSGLLNARLRGEARRRAFLIASATYAISFPLFYFSSPANVWLLTSLMGFAIGVLMPNVVTSASLFPEQRTRERLLSLYTLALSTSLIAGPSIESAVLLKFNLFQAFLLFSPLAALVFALSFFLDFPKSVQEVEGRVDVWRRSGFKLSVALNLMYGIPFGTLTTFGGIFAINSFGASYSTATLLFSLFFTTSFLGRLALTIYPPKRLWGFVGLSTSLTFAGLVMAFFSRSLLMYALALIVLGVPHGITYPVSLISISRSFSEGERSVANSYFSAVMTGFSSFVPLLISGVVDVLGIRGSFGVLALVTLLFTAYIFNVFKQEQKQG